MRVMFGHRARLTRLPLGRIAAVLATLGFLALMAYGMVAARDAAGGGTRVNWRGASVAVTERPAPPFDLRLLGGGSFRLADQRGSVTVVNFWASWCPPCRDEAAALEAAHRENAAKDVILVGVNVWDRESDAHEFLEETGVSYPNGVDPTGEIAVDYGVRGIPETHVVDREGRLVRRWIGPVSQEQIAEMVAELLE